MNSNGFHWALSASLFTIETAQNSGSSKAEINKNDRTIPSDVMYAKNMKLDNSYSYVVLFSESTYKIKKTAWTERTALYPIGSLIHTKAVQIWSPPPL